jgi:hypothetical protein
VRAPSRKGSGAGPRHAAARRGRDGRRARRIPPHIGRCRAYTGLFGRRHLQAERRRVLARTRAFSRIRGLVRAGTRSAGRRADEEDLLSPDGEERCAGRLQRAGGACSASPSARRVADEREHSLGHGHERGRRRPMGARRERLRHMNLA